ncbi:MAG: phosphoenolpyruvate synthase, partial [Gammaproteobacteria bacterium]|nr:phosphoenolpyruvate synthase [Gammaproteobacteria bacterium]
MAGADRFIRTFAQISSADLPLVGGKTASLGEMYQALRPQGVPIPNGFAITTEAYRHLLEQARLWQPLRALLAPLRVEDPKDLAERARQARHMIYSAGLPADLEAEILAAYRRLMSESAATTSLAVRSSATAEDLPTVSFAGQQDSFLNIEGESRLLEACRRCFASLFTDRAIHYRVDNGFDHFKVALSVAVQKMVRADRGASGVMFTLDTESGFRDVVLITGSYGLGENIVQGAVEPDEFLVFKPTFRNGLRTVLRHTLGSKKIKMIYADGAGAESTRNVATTDEERDRYCLSDQQILTLTDYALKIEWHYSERAGSPVPMDIEWAEDGLDGQLYVVQARPET